MKHIDVKNMHPKELIVKIITRIYKTGMTTTSGGNISVIDDNGDIWISPSAVDKGRLSEADICCIQHDGTIHGRHKPSSEFPFHKAIYAARPDLKAIIHAHPPALVSFSIIRSIPNTRVLPQAHRICGPVGYAPYGLPGSEELGRIIANTFTNSDYKAIIMENHGTVLGGSDLLDAYQRFETLELCAQTIINAKAIGAPRYLSEDELNAFERQLPKNTDSNKKHVYSSKEKALRKEICQIVHRACEQDLMISSYGTVSVRLHDDSFLITPGDIARWNLQPADIVNITNGQCETEKIPSRTAYLHNEIYLKNPGIQSVIITQPPNLMAFATSGVKFDVRTIPESWIFLQDVQLLPFGSQFYGNQTIPEILSDSNPALFIENDGFLVSGGDLLQTFDRLEVAEFSAKSIIMSQKLGDMVPINQQQVEDLRKKFLS